MAHEAKRAGEIAGGAGTLALVLLVGIADCSASLAAPQWAEFIPVLLVLLSLASMAACPTPDTTAKQDAVALAKLLAMIPCVALALASLMGVWWSGIGASDDITPRSTNIGFAFVLFTGLVAGFVGSIVERFFARPRGQLDIARWLPKLQSFARALALVAAVLVLAATARRGTGISPDAMKLRPAVAVATFVASNTEAVVLRLDADRVLVARTTSASIHGVDLYLRDRRANNERWITPFASAGAVQYDPRLGCVRLTQFARSSTRCLDDITRDGSAWTQRRKLAPTMSWIAMGVLAIGLLAYATRLREHKRWRRANVNVDESVAIDEQRYDAAEGVTIPHRTTDVWVITVEQSSGEAPYRAQTTREVIEVSVDVPFAHELRTVCWLIASALLFLTPLLFALAVGMIVR